MKTTRLLAIPALLLSTTAALADDDATVQGARFASTAPAPVIAAAACTLHAALTIEGKPRRVDVMVDARRCETTEAPEDAVPVNVRVADGHVVIEGAAQGVSNEVMQPVVVALARELRGRIERALTPPAPAPVVVATPRVPVRVAAQQEARTPYDPRWDERPEKVPYSPTMMGFGVTSMALGSVMFFAGGASLLSSHNDGSGGAWMFAGVLLSAAVGVPLFCVGKHKVPRVVATVAPTGGSLRLAF